MGRYFGTDGIRGEANKELTVEKALRLGYALGYHLKNTYKNEKILMVFYYIYFSMLCCFSLANLMFFSKFLINLFL